MTTPMIQRVRNEYNRTDVAVTTTGREYEVGRPASDDVVATGVLAALWCRSVGTSWTLELHELDGGTALGAIMDWISSGVPISQPEPEALARELLAERGLELFCDSSAGPGTHSRHGIGYVSANTELMRLAHLVRDAAAETGVHPVVLATQWVAAGFSADAAASWIRDGVRSPQVAPNPGVPVTDIDGRDTDHRRCAAVGVAAQWSGAAVMESSSRC
ncbi:MAG: hypothetical protein ACRDSP_05020 [Pseudonocardiaceae bacterium]